VFLIHSRAGCKKYVTRLRLVTYFLQPASVSKTRIAWARDRFYIYTDDIIRIGLYENYAPFPRLVIETLKHAKIRRPSLGKKRRLLFKVALVTMTDALMA